MISFHRDIGRIGNEKTYYRGFQWVEVADFQRLAKAINCFAWSPCRWAAGRRASEHFREARLIGLDFDSGTMTLEQAQKNFCDSAHIIGTTKSHRKMKGGVVADRFRVVLRLTEPVTSLATYRATVAHYIEKYDCDSACKDGARFFWPCMDIVSIEETGYDQEIIQPPPPRPTRENVYRKYGIVRRRSLAVLHNGFVEGNRNNDWFMVAKDLYDAGRSEADIWTLIAHAPPYCGVIPFEDQEEIAGCISKGIKSVESGKAYGRDEGPARERQGSGG